MTPRYYLADETDGEGDGTYEFRPLNEPSKLYSDLDKVEVHEGESSGQFLITFEETADVSMANATLAQQQEEAKRIKARLSVAVELSKLSEFVQFEVTLNEIPYGHYSGNHDKQFYEKESERDRGKDVVIDWEFLDFDTDKNFWVDANGLDMHAKRLWHRKDYAIANTDNQASNFYPITSAIAVRDKNTDKQVTIMPDRAQAGSAGMRKQRNIELMQNRRHNGFDNYGVPKALDDQDSSGRGIQIKATYQMQIFRRGRGDQSAQRKMQRMVDQPLVVSYSKDFELGKAYNMTKTNETSLGQKNHTAQSLVQDTNYKLRHSDIFKSLVYAFGPKQVLVRVQNMQDIFDGPGDALAFDVEHFAKTLYK